MPEVHADPEKLKQLAKALTTAADQLHQVSRSISRSLESSGWQDSERQKFEQEFKQAAKSLSQFTDRLRSDYAPMLQRKATALEQYSRR